MFGKKRREKEEREARALEKIMLEVIKAEEQKEQKIEDLGKIIKEQFSDFPIHKLLHILVKKNIIQISDLKDQKNP